MVVYITNLNCELQWNCSSLLLSIYVLKIFFGLLADQRTQLLCRSSQNVCSSLPEPSVALRPDSNSTFFYVSIFRVNDLTCFASTATRAPLVEVETSFLMEAKESLWLMTVWSWHQVSPLVYLYMYIVIIQVLVKSARPSTEYRSIWTPYTILNCCSRVKVWYNLGWMQQWRINNSWIPEESRWTKQTKQSNGLRRQGCNFDISLT